MGKRNFHELLKARFEKQKTMLCVGLDTEWAKIPARRQYGDIIQDIVRFNGSIIEWTMDLVCAYKPNLAFYVSQGNEGVYALKKTIECIRLLTPMVPVILDAKIGDIGKTNIQYAHEIFEFFGADAVTVHPYLGREAMKQFLDREEKGILVLCRTSNEGAGEFQDLVLPVPWSNKPRKLYEHVAHQVATVWNEHGNCGLVVGATYPEELATVREILQNTDQSEMPILIPGIGTQGGDIAKTVRAGKNYRGEGMIINSSSGIIFADDPRAAATSLRDEINRCIKEE
ncbi:MAG TPA: orotidine-5'-phosphate decarboxylase [Candidatus Paceibacterota bacterium]|jgi:orotidine-5'-phosphate decarboxylase|nr:orotidine-5'-phosphate decarboxylase [Candidatus Paceibacterota bacterium]